MTTRPSDTRLALRGRRPRTAPRPHVPQAGGLPPRREPLASSVSNSSSSHGSELNNNLGFGTAGDLGLGPLLERFFLLGGGRAPPGRDPRGGSDGAGAMVVAKRPEGSKKPAPSSSLCGGCGPSLAGQRGRGTEGAMPAQGSRPPLGTQATAGRLPTSAALGEGDRAPSLELPGRGPPALGPGLSACSQVPPQGVRSGWWVCLHAARGMVRGFGGGALLGSLGLIPLFILGCTSVAATKQGTEARSRALTTILCARAVLFYRGRRSKVSDES